MNYYDYIVNPFDEMNAIYDSKVSYLLEDMDDSTKSSKEENYYPKEKNQNEEMKARVDTDPLEDKNYCSNQNATDDADCKMEKNNEMEIDDNGDLKNKENVWEESEEQTINWTNKEIFLHNQISII